MSASSRHRVVIAIVLVAGTIAADRVHAAEFYDGKTIRLIIGNNTSGGYAVFGPAETSQINEMFDPEAEAEKRQRVRAAIAAHAMELSGSGISVERLASCNTCRARAVSCWAIISPMRRSRTG